MTIEVNCSTEEMLKTIEEQCKIIEMLNLLVVDMIKIISMLQEE